MRRSLERDAVSAETRALPPGCLGAWRSKESPTQAVSIEHSRVWNPMSREVRQRTPVVVRSQLPSHQVKRLHGLVMFGVPAVGLAVVRRKVRGWVQGCNRHCPRASQRSHRLEKRSQLGNPPIWSAVCATAHEAILSAWSSYGRLLAAIL